MWGAPLKPPATRSATLYLTVGPVGAGKTTWAQRHLAAHPGLLLDLDHWMVRLYGADTRPTEDVLAWYLARRQRCRELMWDVANGALESGCDVVLELGLIGAAERAQAYDAARGLESRWVVVCVDAPRDVRRTRVMARNTRGGPVQVVPPEHFERASDLWEPLTLAERRNLELLDV